MVALLAAQDKNEWIELHELLTILNRVMNEQERGGFHMTVKELQDLFQQHDADYSGTSAPLFEISL